MLTLMLNLVVGRLAERVRDLSPVIVIGALVDAIFSAALLLAHGIVMLASAVIAALRLRAMARAPEVPMFATLQRPA